MSRRTNSGRKGRAGLRDLFAAARSSGAASCEIDLAGARCELRYSPGAMYRIEEALGASSPSDVFEMISAGSTVAFVTTVWGGLIWERPELTRHEVADGLEAGNVQAVIDACAVAVTRYAQRAGGGST